MKVWFISKYSRTPKDGELPARSFSLLRAMARKGIDCTLLMAGHDPLVKSVFSVHSSPPTIIDSVRVISLSALRYGYSSSPARVLGWLQFEVKLLWYCLVQSRVRPDVIVASSLSLLSVLSGVFLKRRFSCPLVFEVRDIWPLILIKNAGFRASNPLISLMSWIERLGYKEADYIVGTMPNLEEHVANILGYKKRVHCIPMGVPEELLSDDNEGAGVVLKPEFPSAQFVVTHAGSIGMDNALDVLISAARRLKEDQRFAFFIIGSGAMAPKYRAMCSDLKNVVFSDPVPSRCLQPILRRSTVLYFSAHDSEVLRYGQSLNKLVDYMMSGRPIIGSYSGFPSMINESGCGDFVSAGDSVALADKFKEWANLPVDELTRRGELGRTWIQSNRSYDRLASSYLSIFGDRCRVAAFDR